jgi:hypothetical protein
MSFFTLDRHSCTALSKSSDTRRLFRSGFEGGVACELLSDDFAEGVAKGKITVALLNLGAEKRDQILFIVSWGGRAFFFFFGLIRGGGGFTVLRPFLLSFSDSLELIEDILVTN